jgi:CRISPR-associated endonuclease/helicase Cas3
MSRNLTKVERLIEMERLYYLRAYSDEEMGKVLDVDRTLAFRYRKELSAPPNNLEITKGDDGRWKINRMQYISSIRLNRHEALVLYLAARRASQQGRLAGTHLANTLEKLSQSLKQPMTERLVKAADDVLKRHVDPERVKVIEKVAQAWVEGRKLRIHYQSLGASESRQHTIQPYLIEPSTWSDSVYLIAYNEEFKNISVYKIDRIVDAFVSGETFEIPAGFDESALLKHAWGIWARDGEPVTVKLRFLPGVAARRLRESVWHPLEEVTETEDGGCLWQALIAEPKEMLPWIRGWGADCEVISPPALQKELRKETRKLMRLYLNNAKEKKPAHYALWAKAQRKGTEFHPLLYHLIDVGMCTKALWDGALSSGLKEQLSKAFSAEMSAEETGDFLAFLAATHDIGKASPSFQQRNEPSIKRLKDVGFVFPKRHGDTPAYHGTISAWALKSLFKDVLEIDTYEARRFAHALGGHHGILPSTSDVNSIGNFDKGDEKWAEARSQLLQELEKVFAPRKGITLTENIEEENMILMLLLGLTTAADWLGSDERFFDYEDRFFSAENYADEAEIKAEKALKETGWSGAWTTSGKTKSFKNMFPFSPNEIQKTVIQHAEELSFPTLLILEAPTGIGKTEAALYLADTWLQKQKGRGLYIAMPTQATSNQMFERTLEFLHNRYPKEKINIHLAHGQAQWNEDMKSLHLSAIGEGENDIESQMRAESWFLPRKKTLLAPFGVGTVDQALMSTLQTRHFFLRLFGLANKVVIFDEVHAYDTYMGKLFLRLLAWLRAIGTSVIVLSATLPEVTRREMADVFCQKLSTRSTQAQYPRLTLATSQKIETIELPSPDDHIIQLKKINQSPERIVQELETRLEQGGCAAVICNTVQRAQDIYFALQEADFVSKENLSLFHSRFPPAWRKDIEAKVLNNFGKNGERPDKAIVVATQVIEQSLDLDFDLMISDLAPVDLLIQRIGRLHRHERDARPLGLLAPQILIAQPEGDASAPDFGSSAYVYAPFILWRTWLTLEGRSALNLPSETSTLIEAVYGKFNANDFAPEIAAKLEKAQAEMFKEFGVDAYKAERNLIPKPSTENLVTQPMQDLKDDEDPTLHEQIKAVTRLIPPGINLVCLHKMEDGGLNTEPNGTGDEIDLKRIPKSVEVEKILKYTISLHRQDIVKVLAEKTHPKWKRKTALRYHIPLFFENGRCSIANTKLTLILEKELGLQVEKEIP